MKTSQLSRYLSFLSSFLVADLLSLVLKNPFPCWLLGNVAVTERVTNKEKIETLDSLA